MEEESYNCDLFLLECHFPSSSQHPEFTRKTRLAVIPGSRNSICNISMSKHDIAQKLHKILGY